MEHMAVDRTQQQLTPPSLPPFLPLHHYHHHLLLAIVLVFVQLFLLFLLLPWASLLSPCETPLVTDSYRSSNGAHIRPSVRPSVRSKTRVNGNQLLSDE